MSHFDQTQLFDDEQIQIPIFLTLHLNILNCLIYV